ncbi:histidine phosphatase superfamily [Thelephora terrestris]|uniref:Histidine phosphatase superfamily n=1 Tax=Thelephora terrestris TaxID=56493 RepID=A0A9P6L8N9_9AGAM|nr:histidine phosphatase superfamily [Thelephora terrestris]
MGTSTRSYTPIVLAFFAGIITTRILFPQSQGGIHHISKRTTDVQDLAAHAQPWVGSTEFHPYPPASPVNYDPTLFPSDIGYSGPTPTGGEPALLATAPAYPKLSSGGQGLLVVPDELSTNNFDILKRWGNLSPWYSNPVGTFGVEAGPEAPDGCSVTGLHLLHRHGARYPTRDTYSPSEPAAFGERIHAVGGNWTATGKLAFLNDWTFKLGGEVLTPFGRHQLFELGATVRLKYGNLLKNFTETNTLPVFRTESQDRMLASALNFAIGFFGYPFDGQYEQSITIESSKFNNTLAPYTTCLNAWHPKRGGRAGWFVTQWANRYLQPALKRINSLISGHQFEIPDIFAMQNLCAYETVALGYSSFCPLFTKEEWEGFDYSFDLNFWYTSGFGSPVGRAQGIGYVQELVARLTKTPIQTHNSTTNSTLDDNPITFPLDGRSLYVDATHEVTVVNVLTALNLSTLAATGPLPYDYIPENRSFIAHEVAPFATNVQFQLLSCASTTGEQIRVIVNDAPVPLSPLKYCPEETRYGLCPVDGFVSSLKEIIQDTDFAWACLGDYILPDGDAWLTVDGTPPPKHENFTVQGMGSASWEYEGWKWPLPY